MVITFSILFLSFGYLCYQAKDEIYLTENESHKEKDHKYTDLEDLFI